MGVRVLLVTTVIGSAFASAMPAFAADCAGSDQHSLNRCAEDEYRAADRSLNAQYKVTRKAMAAADPDAERLLIAAQRAWIGFRDAHCEASAHVNHGGSMEPLTRFGCLAEATAVRTEQLKQLAEDYGN